MFKYKPQLLFHHTARFPWHPLFLNLSLPSLQCQECPRSNLSGMCPVCTLLQSAYPSLVIPRSKGLTGIIPRAQILTFQLPDYQITRLLNLLIPPRSSQDLKDLQESSQGMSRVCLVPISVISADQW